MKQILFHLPDWLGGAPIYSYGVLLVVGFFAALQLAKFLARRVGIHPDVFVNAGLVALVAGVAGARLSHVLENLGQYTDPSRSAWANFLDAVNIRSGGLTFYGGLLLATPCTIAYGMMMRVPIRLGMDVVAPCVMVGLAFGRIGCLLNGCCYGAECDTNVVPWAFGYPYHSNAYVEEFHRGELTPRNPKLVGRDADGRPVLLPLEVVARDPELRAAAADPRERSKPLHPAQIYSTITAFLIAGLLVAFLTVRPAPGRVFALMLLVEAPSRFVLEMLRAEPAVIGRSSDPPRLTGLPPMSFSMVLSVGLLIVGVVLWFAFRRRYDGEDGGAEGVPLAGRPATA